MKRIAVVCTLYGPNGGTGRVTTEVIERYAADGNEVHVFCGDYDENFARKSHVSSINKLHITKIGILQQLDMLIKASRKVKPADYDLIYATGDYHLNPDIITLHILKRHGRKVIERLEKKGVLNNRHSAIKRIARKIYCPLLFELGERIVYRRDTATYVGVSRGVSEEFKKSFNEEGKKNVIVIPNGVDNKANAYDPESREHIRKELGIGQYDKVLLFAGSDWNRKRLDIAIELCSRHQELQLIVAGHDQPEEYIKRCEHLGILNRIHFVGFRKDIERFYSAADYFVFSSAYETFGLVAMEAMAAGMVVISNRLNGVEDFICDGRNGFLTDDESVESFDKKLCYILAHENKMDEIRKNASLTAAEFRWENCYAKYKALFDAYTRR